MRLQILQLVGKETTDIYPLTHLRVERLDEKLIGLVIKWHSMSYGGELKIQKHDGSYIHYQGVAYAGSSVQVFWGSWMNDYLKNDSLQVLNEIANAAQEANYDVATCVNEAVELLLIMASRVYDKMADVDSKLRGDGINFGELHSVTGYKSRFNKYITSHAKIIADQHRHFGENKEVDNHCEDFFNFKPNIYGLGVNLNEGYRRIKRFFRK